MGSNTINKIPLDDFVGKDSNQNLKFGNLSGEIEFENLHLKGLFNNINVTEFDQEALKLNGHQFISSTLMFLDNLQVDDLEVQDTINAVNVTDYYFKNGNRIFNNPINFDAITVSNLVINGNLETENSSFNFEDFDKRRMSKTKNQNISGNFTIKTSKIDSLKPDYMNDIFYEDLFSKEVQAEKILDLILQNKISINSELKSLSGNKY